MENEKFNFVKSLSVRSDGKTKSQLGDNDDEIMQTNLLKKVVAFVFVSNKQEIRNKQKNTLKQHQPIFNNICKNYAPFVGTCRFVARIYTNVDKRVDTCL